MSLTLIATPIGNIGDISLRALETLKSVDVVIGEEFKEVSKLLKALEIPKKELYVLNEHSTPEDLNELLKICETKNVALVTDCGTPGFCDPGAHLVKLCRKVHVPVHSLPGASSLMHLISLSGERLNEFVFRGFLPAEQEARQKELKKLTQEKRPIVLMDTPYRLHKLVQELALAMPTRRALLSLNQTQADENTIDCELKDMHAKLKIKKAEFMILLY